MKLYKKDSKGKIRELNIFAEGADIVQISGLIEGKKVEHRTTCKPKNVGRSNETTAEEQALSEVKSKITKKRREGYFDTVEEAKNTEVVLPMLAKDYKKQAHKIDWNKGVYLQPKLDGMRCLAFVKKDGNVKLMSRDGKTVENMQHIEKVLSNLGIDIVLDGELYVHGENFQTNMKYIKKYRKGLTEKIKFCMYDLISDEVFSKRTENLSEIFNNLANQNEEDLFDGNFPITNCGTSLIYSQDKITEYHNLFLKEGFEGTMVRIPTSIYKVNGRSSELLKYKDFKDIACTIVDIGPAKRRPTWARPVVEWNGKRFACGTKMSHADREEMLKNKADYIGKTAEIRYFEESEEGIPRFPVMVGVRLDK